MFWKLIRPIISEETHNKIIVLGSDKQTWKKGIEPFAQPHQFPEKYGGSLPDGQKLPLDDLGFYGYIFQNGNNQPWKSLLTEIEPDFIPKYIKQYFLDAELSVF